MASGRRSSAWAVRWLSVDARRLLPGISTAPCSFAPGTPYAWHQAMLSDGHMLPLRAAQRPYLAGDGGEDAPRNTREHSRTRSEREGARGEAGKQIFPLRAGLPPVLGQTKGPYRCPVLFGLVDKVAWGPKTVTSKGRELHSTPEGAARIVRIRA